MSVCDEDVKIGGNGGPAGWLWGSDTMTHGPFLQLHLRPNMQIQTQFFSSQFLPNFRKCRIRKKDGREERRDGREIRDRGNRRGTAGIGGTENRADKGTRDRGDAKEAGKT